MEALSEASLTWALVVFFLHIGIGHKFFKQQRKGDISEGLYNLYIAGLFLFSYLVYKTLLGPAPGIVASAVGTLLIFLISKTSRR